jgi:fibronectin type 3 domain-containing protein
MRRRVLFLSLIISLFATTAFALGIRVTWQANTESDLAGYKIYYGTQSGVYGAPIDAGNVTQKDILNLRDGVTYYVAVTAYDLSGNESAKSQEASVKMPDVTPPAAPSKPTLSIIDQIVRWFKALFHIA